jgi:hypothetical protein
MNLKRGKIGNRGQVTIFIIIAILVVALAVLAYFLIPNLRSNISVSQQSPTEFVDTCMREKVLETIETLSLQGGSIEVSETNSYFYKGDYVKYLCYSGEYWTACTNQEPFIREHFESEIENEIQDDVNSCFDLLVASYENQGYEVVLKNSQTNADAEILPERTIVNFENEITITKGGSETYDSFYIRMDNNLYELLEIAKNIVVWEIDTGDSISEAYMTYDPYLKVEKRTKTDDTKIYILTDRRTDDFFQFAVRSYAMPPGYN